MQNTFIRGAAFALVIVAGTFASANAATGDCASNQSLAQVHRRLDGAIDRLQHDQRDYGGHRESAIDDLQRARTELVAAEAAAIEDAHDNARCFRAHGATGGSDAAWGVRGDRSSDRNLRVVGAWVERMVDRLQRDNHDYGGHRVRAIGDMQAARAQLTAAERYDASHRG